MPQTFQVLQCYSCETFQVHQVKKVNKWTCKVCNEKQSIKKVYGQGSAADCRKNVQTLNMMRGDKEKQMSLPIIMPPDAYSDYSESGEDSPYNTTKQPTILAGRNGRWAIFAEPKESDSDQDEGGHGTFTTSRTEFEQVCKKLKKEESKVQSLHAKVTGFHPIASKQGRERSHLTTSLSTSTYTVSPDHAYSSKDPYSSTGEDLDSILQEHRAMSVSSSKSLHNVDDVYGHYRKINDDSANLEPHPQSSVSVGNYSRHSSDSQDKIVVDLPMSSKWNKYLSAVDQLSAEETTD